MLGILMSLSRHVTWAKGWLKPKSGSGVPLSLGEGLSAGHGPVPLAGLEGSNFTALKSEYVMLQARGTNSLSQPCRPHNDLRVPMGGQEEASKSVLPWDCCPSCPLHPLAPVLWSCQHLQPQDPSQS